MKPDHDRQDRILHLPRERETAGERNVRLLPRTPYTALQAHRLVMTHSATSGMADDAPTTVRVSVKKTRRLTRFRQ